MPLSSPSGGILVHSEQAARELGFDLHRRHTGSWADGSVTKPGSPACGVLTQAGLGGDGLRA